MAIKVIAQLREVKLGKNPGKKFVWRPDLYVPIAEKKVFQEAATHSGISAGVIKAAWDAARVTSGDSGEIEDNENGTQPQNGGSTSGNGGADRLGSDIVRKRDVKLKKRDIRYGCLSSVSLISTPLNPSL